MADRWIERLAAIAIALVLWLGLQPTALAARTEVTYSCVQEPLVALYDNGPVDDPRVNNQLTGTLPGAFVVLRWRNLNLQLPRTNIAGAPTYSDNKWFWGLTDPEHPTFFLKVGDRQDFACDRLDPTT
ncbi:hypothetical protein [Synechococcus elongatus]|uniref:hypothetical protein n=1 Tax=Synechococcus elongatus TaxID=32046 RepID=UPI000F7DE467|nr:hypothetical protein [Synechococcus elongatus]